MADIQRLWILLAIALFFLILYSLQPILTPFLVGALLAYLGDPLADRLEALKLSRTSAVCVVFVGFSSLAAVAILLAIPLIGSQLNIFAIKLPQWLSAVQEQLIPWLQQTFDLPEGVLPVAELKAVVTENWSSAGGLLSKLWSQLAGSSLALLGLLANVFLIPVVTFYLLRDWDDLVLKINNLLPRRMKNTVVELTRESDEILGAFIRGQLLVMLLLGIIYAIGLWFVGLDLALLLGLVAGLASIVPYMGVVVGVCAAGVAAYFQFHDIPHLVGVAAVFTVGQMLEGMLLTPLLVGDRIGLHPVAVIFAIMAGGQLAGFTGILLALPVAAVLMVLVRYLHLKYKDSHLYQFSSELGEEELEYEKQESSESDGTDSEAATLADVGAKQVEPESPITIEKS
jgi:predicted PurR-regulated permease PerM